MTLADTINKKNKKKKREEDYTLMEIMSGEADLYTPDFDSTDDADYAEWVPPKEVPNTGKKLEPRPSKDEKSTDTTKAALQKVKDFKMADQDLGKGKFDQPEAPSIPKDAEASLFPSQTPKKGKKTDSPSQDLASTLNNDTAATRDEANAAKNSGTTQAESLADIRQRLQSDRDELLRLYKKDANKKEWYKLAEQFAKALTTYAAAREGARKGVDLSNIKVDGIDWDEKARNDLEILKQELALNTEKIGRLDAKERDELEAARRTEDINFRDKQFNERKRQAMEEERYKRERLEAEKDQANRVEQRDKQQLRYRDLNARADAITKADAKRFESISKELEVLGGKKQSIDPDDAKKWLKNNASALGIEDTEKLNETLDTYSGFFSDDEKGALDYLKSIVNDSRAKSTSTAMDRARAELGSQDFRITGNVKVFDPVTKEVSILSEEDFKNDEIKELVRSGRWKVQGS